MFSITNHRLAAKSSSVSSKYNVVVVGGGTSGCLIATRLAMDGLRVLLVEKGEDTTKKPRWHTLLPAGKQVHKLLKSGYEDATLQTTPQRNYDGTGSSPVHMPYPTVLGGSGVVGPRSWIRGSAADWEDTPWSYLDDIAPQIKHFEAVFNAPLHRGKHGRFLISRPAVSSPFYLPFSDALIAEKVPFVVDFNDKEGTLRQGFGRPDVAVNINDGTSTSTLLQHLAEAQKLRYPITVMAQTTAVGLQGSDGVIDGVVVKAADGSEQTIEAESVVVTAGAVRSAELLLHPRSKAAIPKLPAEVGTNLWDSPVTILQYRVKSQDSHHVYEDKLVQLIERIRWQRGEVNALSSAYDDMTCFFATTPGGPVDARITIQPFAMDNLGNISAGGHGIQLRVELCKPFSRGSISVGNEGAVVDPRYFTDERDQKAMSTAVEFARKIALNPSMGRLCKDTPVVELLEASCKSGGTLAAATCVDPATHRLNGAANVYVCGSSLFPSPVLGDHLPFTLAFGDRFADMYLNKKAKLRIPAKSDEAFFERSIAAPAAGGMGGTKEKVKVTYY